MHLEKPRPLPQKTIGVLGGMSNQATGEYYRLLNKQLNEIFGGWDNGEIVIVSVNFGNIECFVRANRWEEARAYLSGKVDRLERAGADVVICVSNTMHRVMEPIMAERSIPFIHITDPTGEAICKAGIAHAGLLGTMPVMNSIELRDRYRDRFGVEIIVPPEKDREIVDGIIFNELVRGEMRNKSKQEYLRIVNSLRKRGAEAVILGCTEICLLISQDDLPDLPVFDTTELHVRAAVDMAHDRG